MKTINLRIYRTHIQPHAPAAIMLITIVALLILNAAATWPAPASRPVAAPTPALPIVVFTQAHEGARPIAVRERIVYVVATPTAEPAPVAAPAAAEAPAPTPWVVDPQIVQTGGGSVSTFEVPAAAPRLCTGFGDWRDYDANYASSPICHQEAP